jgi:hypothetical protein
MGVIGAIIAMVIAGIIIYGIIYYGPSILQGIQGSSGGTGGGGGQTSNIPPNPTIGDIVTHPDLYDNQTLEITGYFVKQTVVDNWGHVVVSNGYLVDPHTYANVYDTPKLFVFCEPYCFPLGEYQEYRVTGRIFKMPNNWANSVFSYVYTPYENMVIEPSSALFAIYPTSITEPVSIKNLVQSPSTNNSKIIVVVGKCTDFMFGIGTFTDDEGYTVVCMGMGLQNISIGWRYLLKGLWTWSPTAQRYVLDVDVSGFAKPYPKTDEIYAGLT